MLELLASEYRGLAQNVLAFSLIALAFVWGGGPERAVAATWLIVFELFGLMTDTFWGSGQLRTEVDLFLAIEDFVACAAWIGIALYANRNYTLWIAAMQVLAVTAHLARGMVETISPIAYVTMTVAPGWFQLILLGIGLTRHILRKRRYGPYRDWRITDSLPPPSTGSSISPFATLLAKSQSNWRDEIK